MTRHLTRTLLLLLCLSFASPLLQSQTANAPPPRAATKFTASSLLPGPKPPDAPAAWKRFVGIYEYSNNGNSKVQVIILERNQIPYLHYPAKPEEEIYFDLNLKLMSVPDPVKRAWSYSIEEEPARPPYFAYLSESFVRTDPGANPANYFHIKPLRPIDQLRSAALATPPPAEQGPFRKPELVELATLDAAIHLDIRYAQSNNFLSTPIYTQARAFLQRPAAEALLRVLHKLQPLGYGLLIHDAYRPWYVTKIFWDAAPPVDHIFVADPQKGSRHNRGCAVDLTLYDLSTGKPVEMTGMYDEMSPRSFPDFPGGTSLQRWHRDLLRRAMESEGFTVNEEEWWHFDYKDWKQYPILNVPFENLGIAAAPAV
ncbi:MAG TPA: M15 family metallopeptidase [Verrucomicrobiae bacterium]|nr:M15 family metallopeptidase [Verrucomicrobiae bacterium]